MTEGKRGVGCFGLALCLGWALPVPAQDQPAGPEWAYRVQPGDTLVDIAARQLDPAVDWPRLARLNRLERPHRLKPGSVLRIPLAWLRHDPVGAEVLHLRGDVRRIADGLAMPLAVGDRLRPGERVETGPQASASLRFADGSRLLLTPGSSLRIEQAGQHADSNSVLTRLAVQRGSAETRAEPRAAARRRFEISTPIVNLGVRGTEFRTHAGLDDARVEVLAGRVAAGESVTVDAGFGSVAKPGLPVSAPVRLADAPDLSTLTERIESGPLTLEWPAVAGVQGYRAQLWSDGPQGNLLLDDRVAGPAVVWPALPDGQYQLRVRVVDGQGLEGLDARRHLLVAASPPVLRPAPAAPVLPAAPLAAAPLAGPQGVLWHWQAVAAASSYQVQAAHEAGFAAPMLDLALSSLQVLLPLIEPGRYALRLRALAPDGAAGPYGGVHWVDVVPPAPGAGRPAP